MKKFVISGTTRSLLSVLFVTTLAVGCGGGGQDTIFGSNAAGGLIFNSPAGAIAPGAVCPTASLTVPVVVATTPTNGNQFVTTSTSGVANGGKSVSANFSIPMDSATINATSFNLAPSGGAALVPAAVSYDASSMAATLNTSSSLLANTTYTAVVQSTVKSAAGTALGCSYVWTFKTTPAVSLSSAALNLGQAARYGVFVGTAGVTNTGDKTVVTGSNGATADVGTTATTPTSVKGFHDSASDIYSETGANVGNVTGKIYTCTTSTTGPTSVTRNEDSCTLATRARLDAETAYLALKGLPPGADPGANLAGLTLAPGVYTAPGGSFMILGNSPTDDLTLDAKGNPDATWVFQMATTLTVGGPGSAFPRSIKLAGGAQAKNVFWQVGSSATINAAGGGTMVGNILSEAATSFSTVGNATEVLMNGRVLSLNAGVTLVNTVITVPAP